MHFCRFCYHESNLYGHCPLAGRNGFATCLTWAQGRFPGKQKVACCGNSLYKAGPYQQVETQSEEGTAVPAGEIPSKELTSNHSQGIT
jgi:hypothetical protein